MREHRFVNVETPYLTRSTPEGARDFLVPVRLRPGNWYALPQSPQLFKQLLMVGGLERYYQLARCFRDEDFRKDRQPEFTQIDIEMSFVTRDDVIEVAEDIVSRLWREIVGYEIPRPLPRMTYADAMARYGSDKPDLRFGQEITDLTGYFAGTEFRIFQAPYVGAVVMPGGAAQTRRELDAWQDWAKSRGARGAYVLLGTDGEVGGPVAKNISDAERTGLAAATGAHPGDAVFFAAGTAHASQELLGAARLEIGRRCELIDESQWSFLWVVDAPMFEQNDAGGWTAVHHPFTAPLPEWADKFATEPGGAIADAYDIVCNGYEIGGGSIRIHRAAMQQAVFDVIGLTPEEARSQFGFLLDAFKYGPPPHGGIAFGWDRVTMLLAGVATIRDVIAFPKAASGADPLTGAPTPITAAQRKEAGIDAARRPRPGSQAGPPGRGAPWPWYRAGGRDMRARRSGHSREGGMGSLAKAESESLFDEAERGGRGGRPARGPDAAAQPGRGDRAAAPDRRGHAVPQADRQRRADVADAVGPARHRQDHARLRRQPGDEAPLRGAVRGHRRGQGRARRGRRRPPHAGHERHADRAVHRRSAPVLQDPAGRAASRRWRTAGCRSSARPPRTRSSRWSPAAVPVAAAHPAAAVRRRRAGSHQPGAERPARARRRGHARR